MKKLEKVASDDGRVLGTQVHEELPGAGWISRISLGVLGLIRPVQRKTSAEKVVETERGREAVPGAHRSAMDSGITGGISLLTGGQTDRRRRI